MLKTWVTLGNISRVLLNIIKRFVVLKKTPPLNAYAVNIHILSLVP